MLKPGYRNQTYITNATITNYVLLVMNRLAPLVVWLFFVQYLLYYCFIIYLFQLTGAKAYVKPTLEMYVLQSLQGQFSGFHFLIMFLKTLKLGNFL